MTTTANIQTDGNTAIQHTNNMTGEGTMNYRNDNINMVTRISNAFRMGSISKLIGAVAIGLALTIGVATPGAAMADLPLVSAPTSNVVNNLNDDFSMVYGVPDVGLNLGGASTSAPAKVKANTAIDLFNDDFSMVYGIPDVGLNLGGASTSAPAKVKADTDIDLLNDDFSMVYGIPDVGVNLGGVTTSAPAKVKADTNIGLLNDDFSMVYGIPDVGGR